MKRLLLGAAIVSLLLSPAQAKPGAGRLPTQAEADAIFRRRIQADWIPHVVAVVHPEGTAVYGYGKISAENPTSPLGTTLFEVGSITKVFTGLLLAQLVVEGKMRLDDPVENYLPRGVRVPRFGARRITLAELATHRSGLPRQLKGNPSDPRRFARELARVKLKSKPGTRYLYSNVGAELLGQAVVHAAGASSYEELLTKRVLLPLGMRDSYVAPREGNFPRAAQARDKQGRAKPRVMALRGPTGSAGGLKTTADDMVKFMKAYLDPAKSPFPEAIKLTLVRRDWEKEGDTGIALFWDVHQRQGAFTKRGTVNGFLSQVIVFPDRGVGYFVSRSGDGSPRDIVSPFMKILLGSAAKPQAPEEPDPDAEERPED
jgi:CubicO group peptidase (beta-lactamase class C family)